MRVRTFVRRGPAVAALAFAVALLAGTAVRAGEQWGTIKGQVVFVGKEVPKNPPANVTKDKQHCLAKGDILENKLVVDKKTRGVRWVLVWLADPADATNAKWVPAVHPSLKKVKEEVEIDQPCCVFDPRVIGIQAKQKLVVKNPAPVPHNFAITSIDGGPSENPLIPPGGKATIKGFVPKMIPTTYSCSIHPWMKGWIGTFAHPYFAVTDAQGNFEIKNAPVGKFQLVVWQEECGFVLQKDFKNRKLRGKVIEVKAGGVTNEGKIKLDLPSDD